MSLTAAPDQSSSLGTPGSPDKSIGRSRYINRVVAREVSTLTRYYDRVIQWLPREHEGGVLEAIDAPDKRVVRKGEPFPDLREEEERRTAVLMNGTLNHHFDIQGLLIELKAQLSPTSRVLVVLYNPYLRFLYVIANRIGLRKGDVPSTFITRIDIENLAELAGFSIVRERPCGYFP